MVAGKRRRRGLGLGWGFGLAVLAIAAVAAVLLWQQRGASDRASGPSPTWRAAEPAPTGAPASRTPTFDAARQQLTALPVRGWDRTSDFQRQQFGPAWSDDVNVEFGRNGCNTRDDILRRDLKSLVVRPFTCFAQSGALTDPYTGAAIDFVRGPQTSKSVEIDHVVALADAWYKGARAWDPQRRLDFANDPRNLLAVSPKANFDKAFRDAAGWLPPNAGFRCDFVARQVEVKTAYGLWLSAKEKKAMSEVLSRC
ncbi:HNH endonuclease family protein [Mycolicibacterium sp.]|uniref:HNH endonuclease family protein n=1 Tax=Mycolicibacterium sp. TaxID=2320850 RepID=UPI0028B01140|nr:HNH endonuclease family protein [Mycolicibacterium sp.]